MKQSSRFILALLFVPHIAAAQEKPQPQLSLDRLFSSEEFAAKSLSNLAWIEGGAAYSILEPSASTKDARDVVRYETKTAKRSVLIPANRLIPSGATAPLSMEEYDWSGDGHRLLIYTNSARVWRQNTRGDYWVFDLKTNKLAKLGGSKAKSSTLMFAKFSPDGKRLDMSGREICISKTWPTAGSQP